LNLNTRTATLADLPEINRIIEAAVMTWDLPDRVKRLSLPSYRYTELDLQYFDIVVATENGHIVGVAAWEPAKPADAPKGHTAMLLHGVYVNPAHHRKGIGRRLFAAAEEAVAHKQLDGLVVKAQKGSEPFYTALGMRKLAADEKRREFENRYWKLRAGW
jgi:predicted N-acetyltransferase YhbS